MELMEEKHICLVKKIIFVLNRALERYICYIGALREIFKRALKRIAWDFIEADRALESWFC